MNEPTPIVFYVPDYMVDIDGEGNVDTSSLLTKIGASDVVHRHADLFGATWADLDVIASAQQTGELIRLVIEFSSMDWIDMRLCHPDNSPMHPERTLRLIDAFASAADSLDCVMAFKSMTVLPDGWANWDVFLPDFDRVAGHRSARELVREMVDFGYAAHELEGIEWDGGGTTEISTVLDSTLGLTTDKGTIWFGERMPALT